MDYRRPLFQLEQWSPFLAKKIWGLTSLLESPFSLAMGFKVLNLTDLNVEVEVPLSRFNKLENGEMRSSALVAGGEFACKLLWHRHLSPALEELALESVQCHFTKPVTGAVRARTELIETERERILRKIRAGSGAEYEMPVIFIDQKDQQVANMSCHWRLKPTRTAALGQGNVPS